VGELLNCPECHGALVFPNGLKGEIICKRCGLVMSRGQSSQGFTKWAPKWFSNWNENDSDTLREWLTTLRTVSCQLNLPDFPYREETARTIKLKSDMLFRSQRFGKNKREAIAALVHLVLRKYNEIRPLREICETLSLDHRLVTKYAWTMRKMTGFHRTFSPKDYLRKYGWKLTSNAELIQRAEQLLASLRKEISGNPVSLAAGAFYFVCKSRKMRMSKDEIGEAFHISGRTVYSNERRISRLMSTKSFGL
jgi:transcription initiation factor TFIIIB Brf1 subunit/transcription initiation factor TFIIB